MKRLIMLFVMLAAVAAVCVAGDRSGTIKTGTTELLRDLELNASDTINADDTIVFSISNPQRFAQMQYFTVGLTDVSGSPSVSIKAYGKVTATSAWVQIGSTITWTSDSNDGIISSTAPINYNYLKVEFIASSATQQTLINVFEVKTSNAFEIPTTAGTVTYSRPTSGVVTLTSKDDDANAGLTIDAGGTGALILGGSTGTTAITSSDWAISATGAATGIGAITSDGDITTTGKVATTDSLCIGTFRLLIKSDTLCSVVGTDTLRLHPARP